MEARELPAHANLEQFKNLANDLVKAHNTGDPEALQRITNQFRPDRSITHDEVRKGVQRSLRKLWKSRIRRSTFKLFKRLHWMLMKSLISLRGLRVSEAKFLIAHEYVFGSWQEFANHLKEMNHKDSSVSKFESAVDAVINGDLPTLNRLLIENPGLITARSTRTHHSTLLHYVSANGVEDFRQKTPKNAVEVAEILLRSGAEVNAKSDAYGGGSTTLGLTATSVHPQVAGVQIALLKTLLHNGATIEGPRAITDCLANGRGEAAVFLAGFIPELDLEGAAGVGRLEVVKRFFNEDGGLKGNATKAQMNSGFAWACEFGRTNVVDFLLQKGMDLDTRLKHNGQTGLHWAAYGGHLEIVKLLVDRKATVNARDESFGGTPLGWALYGWVESPPEAKAENYYDIVAVLVASGATVDPKWIADTDRELPIPEKLHSDPKMLAALGAGMRETTD